MLNYIAAALVVAFLIGFALLLLGMGRVERHGESRIYSVGMWLMLGSVVAGLVVGAMAAAYWLITRQPVQIGGF